MTLGGKTEICFLYLSEDEGEAGSRTYMNLGAGLARPRAGQVLRTGFFNQRLVNDTRKVTLFLRLRVNEDMALNGRYPLVVTNYEERFE